MLSPFQHLEQLERRGVSGAACDAALADLLDLPGFTLLRFFVIVAITGSEAPITGELAHAYILPRLARWGIRLIQVARAGRLKGDGVTVLDDSRCPTELHMRGDYTLFAEMVSGRDDPPTRRGSLVLDEGQGRPQHFRRLARRYGKHIGSRFTVARAFWSWPGQSVADEFLNGSPMLGSESPNLLKLRFHRALILFLGGDSRAALPEFDALAAAYAHTAGPSSDRALDVSPLRRSLPRQPRPDHGRTRPIPSAPRQHRRR